ncbi:MAG: DUF4294 domain-containing protein [Bacteroides sp.]|nr:DUF4294 domain-containing protein [Bacteroides sp.]
MFLVSEKAYSQEKDSTKVYMYPTVMYEGERIMYVKLREVFIYPKLVFKNEKQRREYNKLVYNVKKVYPIAREVNKIIIETYEYLQTIEDKKERSRHIKRVEKSLKEQYTPIMKKLTFSQGKILIKLVDRENNQTSYEIVKAFIGSFRAGFYQAFASMLGASLKKKYDPDGEDAMIERIVTQIEMGIL